MSKQIQTIPANFSFQDSNKVISIPELIDFYTIVTDQKISYIFLYEQYNKVIRSEDRFFITNLGFVYSTPRKGFKDFQEAIEGININITDGKTYSEFIASGCKNREDYFAMRSDGFYSHADMTEFYDLGLDQEYSKISGLRNDEHVHLEYQKALIQIDNKPNFLNFYNKREFSSPADMIEILCSGFDSVNSYHDAKENGFKDFKTYTDVRKAGFKYYDEFIDAESKGFSKSKEYFQYLKDLEKAKEWGISIPEFRHIKELIHNRLLPNRISKLYENLIAVISRRYGSRFQFSTDFLDTTDSFTSFLKAIQNEKSLSELNYSVKDGITMNQKENNYCKVIVDASNVCWYRKNTFGGSGTLPSKDLLEIHSLLKLYKADEILFVADANLRYEVDDVRILDQLEKDDLLVYSNGEQADKKILSMAENRGYLVVSNDQYRDWLTESKITINRIGFQCVKDLGFDLIA